MAKVKRLTKDQEEVWDRLKNGLPIAPDHWSYRTSSVAPAKAEVGSIYFNTDTEQMHVYDGTTWKAVA